MKALVCSIFALSFLAGATALGEGLSTATTLSMSVANQQNMLTDLAPENGKTYFDTLVDWYNQGTPMTLAQLTNFLPGRCFAVNAKSTALNDLLVYATEQNSSDPGPGLPRAPREIKISSIGYGNGTPADYFDDPSAFSRAQVESLIRSEWVHLSSVIESPTLGYTYDWEANGRPDEGHQFKMYNGFVVGQWTALQDRSYGNLGFHKAGDVLEMCYSFQRSAGKASSNH